MEKLCQIDDIIPETGVCALVNDQQIAIFRTRNNKLFALDNLDPFSKANVLSRGLIGGTEIEGEEILYVASPIYKQRFNLATGVCLDDDNVSIGTYPVIAKGNDVLVGL